MTNHKTTEVTITIPADLLAQAMDAGSTHEAWTLLQPLLHTAFEPIRHEFWTEVPAGFICHGGKIVAI